MHHSDILCTLLTFCPGPRPDEHVSTTVHHSDILCTLLTFVLTYQQPPSALLFPMAGCPRHRNQLGHLCWEPVGLSKVSGICHTIAHLLRMMMEILPFQFLPVLFHSTSFFSPALFKCKKWQVSRVANHSYLQFDDVGFTLMWPQWVWESISSLYGRSLWLCCLLCLHFPRAFQCNSDTPAAWSFFLVFLILLGKNSVMK